MRSDHTLTARDLMTREVLVVPATMTAAEVARFLLDNEISGAPVVDADGRPVGVVSFADLAQISADEGQIDRRVAPSPSYFRTGSPDEEEMMRELLEVQGYDAEDFAGLRVEGEGQGVLDFMTPEVVTVAESTPLAELASLMVGGHYHRLLVLHDGRLAGIVTSMDLLRVLAEGGVEGAGETG